MCVDVLAVLQLQIPDLYFYDFAKFDVSIQNQPWGM